MSQPPHRILDIAPDEDVGALTLARYGYQHNCAMPYVLQLLDVAEPVVAVVCETHEDLLVIHSWGPELISVKHRELSSGPWSLAALTADALGHLLDRWQLTGRQARCRLLTNQGLKPGTEQAQQLAASCAATDPQELRKWANRLSDDLSAEASTLVEFLSVLTIDSGLPGRDHIADIFRVHKLRPLMRKLKVGLEADERVYARVLAEVARASSDHSTDGSAIVEALLAEDGHGALATLRRRIRQRTLDKERVGACLLDVPSSAIRLDGDAVPPAPTRLVQKLDAGGLGPTAVRSAQRLRAEWYDLESRWRGLPGSDGDFRDLRARAQALAARIESQYFSDSPYGRAMHVALMRELDDGALLAAAPVLLDSDLLMGLLYQLTDECEVWWSSPFQMP